MLFAGFGIAQSSNYFEYFATSREHSAGSSLVRVQCLHKFYFVIRVIAFAGGWVDLATAILLAAFWGSSRCRLGVSHFSAISATTIYGYHLFTRV